MLNEIFNFGENIVDENGVSIECNLQKYASCKEYRVMDIGNGIKVIFNKDSNITWQYGGQNLSLKEATFSAFALDSKFSIMNIKEICG